MGNEKRNKDLRRKRRKEKETESPEGHYVSNFRFISKDAPIYGCWINQGWQSSGIASIILARKMSSGTLAFAYFYIETGGDGLTHCFGNINYTQDRFRQEFIENSRIPLMRIDISIARRVVLEGLKRANESGKSLSEDIHTWLRLMGKEDTEEKSNKNEHSVVQKTEYRIFDQEEVESELRQMEELEEDEDSSSCIFYWKNLSSKSLSRPGGDVNRLGRVIVEGEKLTFEFWKENGYEECLKSLEDFLGTKIERESEE